jgi:hypothetical protein
MAENRLQELQRWFATHCDGTREHHHGISIQSTDNPGWWVKIALTDTELADRCFTTVADNVDPNGFPLGPRWMMCRLQNGHWHGAGDERRLEEILSIFLTWAAV